LKKENPDAVTLLVKLAYIGSLVRWNEMEDTCWSLIL
jgi:hypothetical protein